MATKLLQTRILGTLAGLTAASLAGGCTTYSVRKSALAPHISPSMRNGQGMGTSSAEAQLGASTLVSAGAPEEGADANAGLYIPRVEVNGALRGRVRENLDIGFLWDHGFRKGAYATSEDQPAPDNGSVYGGGVTTFYSMPTGAPEMRIGLGFDWMIYSIPYVEYRTCVEFCDGQPYTDIQHDRDRISVYALSLIPSWHSGRWTIFGGGTMRNHPTIEKGSIETLDSSDEVEGGPLNVVASAGVEVDVGGGVRAMGVVYQPLESNPVQYMPTLGVALTVPLAQRATSAPPVASPAPGPYARR